MLGECRGAMSHQHLDPNLDNTAIELLRAIFDLAEVDLRANPNLLARLLGLDLDRVSALIQSLRRAGLVQVDRMNLTLAGLAFAVATTPVELRPLSASTPTLRLLAVA